MVRLRADRRISNAYDGDDTEEDVSRLLGDPKGWPPGFRFHPTDEELVLYYLKRKIFRRRIKLAMIGEIDVYKWEPWELPEKSMLRRGDKQWYFFSPRDRKYPNGSRSNRATKHGYWKTTGKDRTISYNSKAAGNKKTLVYYGGRAPKGERTDWVMHEYTLDEMLLLRFNNAQDSYALYKLFMKSGPGPKNGEQYGAPFREEEWEDDGAIVEENSMKHKNGEELSHNDLTGDSVTQSLISEEEKNNILPVGDLEELLLQMSHEQDIVLEHLDFSANASQIDLEPENKAIIMDPYIDTDCFQNMDPTVAHSLPIELPEISSKQQIVIADEEFLEIEDLVDLEASCCLDDITNENLIHDDEFYDPYDHFDANMFLCDSMGLPLDAMNSHFSEDPQHLAASQIISELWTNMETQSLSTIANADQVLLDPPASGSVLAPNMQNSIQVESPSPSWFSSTLSAFLDSVPSSPALASENALISRAIERVSSFRSKQIHAQEQDTAGGLSINTRRRQQVSDRGLLFLSVVVGISAVFWIFTIGVAFKVFKVFWG